jgi:spore germination protein KA
MLGFFISLMNFHTSIFSPIFIANIQLTERGTSFPIFIEILIILFLYDFYRYATSRSPQNYVQSIVIFFGSLVVGQNAIQSGTIGSLIMMITSFAYLSSFAITTNPYLISSINIARLFILIFSYLLGLIGFIFATILIVIYLRSQKNFNDSYLSPFSPVDLRNILNFFFPKRSDQRREI